MDHWVSLYTRIVALLEALREWGVALGPNGLGALQSLVKFFCNWVRAVSSGTDLPPAQTIIGPSLFPLRGWDESGKGADPCLDPISEEDEEDILSLPDSLPDLIDSVREEERLSLIGLIEKGVLPPGLSVYQDSIRPNRFWLR